MTPSFCVKNNKRYNFYRCYESFKHHNSSCPNKNMSASILDDEVLNRLNQIAIENLDSSDNDKQSLAIILRSTFEIWDALFPKARSEFLRSVIQTITYHHEMNQLELAFDEKNIEQLAKTMGIIQEAA